jgi:group I intron endonuclease
MIIYLVTNKINGKQYVGQTTKLLKRRWGLHLSDTRRKSSYYLHRSIAKYGDKNFCVEKIHTCESREELNFVEIFYIELLMTKSPYGYNMADGGQGSIGTVCSETLRNKRSVAAKGKPWTDARRKADTERPRITPACHPERKHKSKGLCKPCAYRKWALENRIGKSRGN